MHTMLDKEGKLYSPKLGTLVRVGVQKSVQVACQPVTMDALLSKGSKGSKGTAKTEFFSEASIICSTLSGSGHPLFEECKQKFDLIVLGEYVHSYFTTGVFGYDLMFEVYLSCFVLLGTFPYLLLVSIVARADFEISWNLVDSLSKQIEHILWYTFSNDQLFY